MNWLRPGSNFALLRVAFALMLPGLQTFNKAAAAMSMGLQEPSRPNILLIISDDHGWGDYGFMGHPAVQTPRLDKLAAQSLVFQRGYSPVPLCRPSLASIITGLHPHCHGVTGNDPALPVPGINAMAARRRPEFLHYYDAIIQNFQRHPNLVRDLVSRGWVALQTGKWWEGDPVKSAGFTHAMTRGDLQGSRHGDVGLEIGRKSLDPIFRFVEAAGSRPWLVWYAPMLPHAPHAPPEDLLEKHRRLTPQEPVARYWASVEWFDRTCGELLDYVDKTGQRTNTIVVYTADNGWIQHPTLSDRPAPRSKLSPYEGGVRTPLMISWPMHLKPRLDRRHLASNLDLWPTLGGMLGLPVPSGLPGINLANRREVRRRTVIFGEHYAHDVAEVQQPTRSLEHRWMVDGWWKLILPESTLGQRRPPELYDLRRDPSEECNLTAQQARRLQRMTRQLDAWWKPQ